MKKDNKKRKPRKELSTGVSLILVLMFVVVFIYFGVCIGFIINSFINYSIDYIATHALITLLVGVVYMTLLLILIRNSDSKNVQPLKWYINCILISFTTNLIISAITVFTLGTQEGNDINFLVGFCIFPFIGIITTPNIIKYVKKDTTKWKKIFYKNGNLHKIKASKDYYRVQTPVAFEKKILSAVYKEQLKTVLFVIAYMVMTIVASVHYMSREHDFSGGIVSDLIELRAKKEFGFAFFLMIIFLAFGIPIIAYYVANAWKKIRVVKNHEYIAYHAIIQGVHNGNIGIYAEKRHYTYKYCTCVGIKEKDVKQTPVTLIFLPDDVFLFPDGEESSNEVIKSL
ncbi:MAG: hypothetical protein J5881_00695 [Clostridia bacterium]|nr:hypothetical protein [Clostridia bacterium]